MNLSLHRLMRLCIRYFLWLEYNAEMFQMMKQKIDKKTEIVTKTKSFLKPLEITDYFAFCNARKRLEILTIIKDALPASEKQLIARLRIVLGFQPYVSKYEIDALKVEQLIKPNSTKYFLTPRFEMYLTDLWKKIQCYRAEHPEEI